jgi:hypothetical protein
MLRASVQTEVRDGEVVEFTDPTADLDGPEAERVELEPGRLGGEQPAPEGIPQPGDSRVTMRLPCWSRMM